MRPVAPQLDAALTDASRYPLLANVPNPMCVTITFVDELVREKIEGNEHSRLAGGHTLDFAASPLPETTDTGARACLGDLLRIRHSHYRADAAP